MARKPTSRETPVVVLAMMIRAAYLEGYIKHNPAHDRREWADLSLCERHVLEHVAANLLAMGVTAPCLRTSRLTSSSKAASPKRRAPPSSAASSTSTPPTPPTAARSDLPGQLLFPWENARGT